MRMTGVWILSFWIGWVCLQSLGQETNAQTSSGARLTVALKGAKAGQWTMDFDAAKALAKEHDLAILLCFTGSDWCPYCKTISEKVLEKPDWQDYASNRFALVYLDFPTNSSLVPPEYRERNKTLQNKMGVQGFPTFVVLDSDGEKVLGEFGATRDTDLLSFMRQTTAAIRARPRVLGAFVKGLSAPSAEEYRELLRQYAKAELDLKEWLATKPSRGKENDLKFEAFQGQIARAKKAVESFESNRTLSELAGPTAVEKQNLLRQCEARVRLLGELEEAYGDLEDWILSRPEDTATHRSTLRAMAQRLADIQDRITSSK